MAVDRIACKSLGCPSQVDEPRLKAERLCTASGGFAKCREPLACRRAPPISTAGLVKRGGGAGASQETGNLRFVTALRLQHLAPAKPDVKLDKA